MLFKLRVAQHSFHLPLRHVIGGRSPSGVRPSASCYEFADPAALFLIIWCYMHLVLNIWTTDCSFCYSDSWNGRRYVDNQPAAVQHLQTLSNIAFWRQNCADVLLTLYSQVVNMDGQINAMWRGQGKYGVPVLCVHVEKYEFAKGFYDLRVEQIATHGILSLDENYVQMQEQRANVEMPYFSSSAEDIWEDIVEVICCVLRCDRVMRCD